MLLIHLSRSSVASMEPKEKGGDREKMMMIVIIVMGWAGDVTQKEEIEWLGTWIERIIKVDDYWHKYLMIKCSFAITAVMFS